MSATPELTTRDVLQQVDRRLTHLEELHLQHEESNDRAHAGLDAKIDGLRTGVDTKIDRNLRWTVGLIVGSWMSTMSAILLK